MPLIDTEFYGNGKRIHRTLMCLNPIKCRNKRGMTIAKRYDVVFERPLVLEIRTTHTNPTYTTVLLMGSPVTFHGQPLPTLATRKALQAVLPLVMGLKCSEVFQGLGSWVFYVVLTPFFTAVAWNA